MSVSVNVAHAHAPRTLMFNTVIGTGIVLLQSPGNAGL